MLTCKICNKQIDGLYGSGRFCSKICSTKFVSRQDRSLKNEKIRTSLKKRGRFVNLTCENCNAVFTIKWAKRHQKFCSRECFAHKSSYNELTKQKIREARCKAIENGNTGCGIKCKFDDIRCDSVLEYAFIKWYKQQYPGASIKRYQGKIESHGITFVPDFIVDDAIIVEVKYSKRAINQQLSKKWKNYIESQDKKKEILESLGRFIWFTDKTCGQKFYRQCLKEVKKSQDESVNLIKKKI